MELDKIKELFFKYNCSIYGLEREEGDLIISNGVSPKAIEEWRQEYFYTLLDKLKESGSRNIYSLMVQVAMGSRRNEDLYILYDAFRYVNFVDEKDCVIIAEDILGRGNLPARDGMVFWANDIKDLSLVQNLLQRVEELIQIEGKDSPLSERYERIKKRYILISSIVHL